MKSETDVKFWTSPRMMLFMGYFCLFGYLYTLIFGNLDVFFKYMLLPHLGISIILNFLLKNTKKTGFFPMAITIGALIGTLHYYEFLGMHLMDWFKEDWTLNRYLWAVFFFLGVIAYVISMIALYRGPRFDE